MLSLRSSFNLSYLLPRLAPLCRGCYGGKGIAAQLIVYVATGEVVNDYDIWGEGGGCERSKGEIC